jgi:hypothetical protein
MGHIRVIQKSFIASLLMFALLAQPSSAKGFSVKYKNCAQLKTKYRLGVALSFKVVGSYPATVSRSIYITNKFLDSDSDGIICENELLQKKLNPSVTTVPPIPTTTTRVTTVPPLPTSPQYVEFENGGSVTLRKGVSYQIYLCSDSANSTSYMDILSMTTGWTQKATGTDLLDATRCSEPGYPYRTSHGWSVSENPGQVTKVRFRGWWDVLEMTVVITN